MEGYRFTTDLVEIDWALLRATLIEDDFDNGRTPWEYEQSARNSRRNVFVYHGEEIVGNGRVLSDDICNAYIVDVWTHSRHRRRGIATEIIRLLTEVCKGQHVYLFTDDQVAFYKSCGFNEQPVGMSLVVGSWLSRDD